MRSSAACPDLPIDRPHARVLSLKTRRPVFNHRCSLMSMQRDANLATADLFVAFSSIGSP